MKQAAEAGSSAGQLDYALALLRGHGAARDVESARMWLQRAADQGDRDAAALLARGLDTLKP